MAVEQMSGQPVTIDYADLVAGKFSELEAPISEAFSSEPTSLGLLVVKNLPREFVELRTRLLLKACEFGSLPENVRERYADASTHYAFGWSKGKEVMNGKPDHLKGSYYANPTHDVVEPATEGEAVRRNVWPSEQDCPGFESAFKDLCKLMVEIGGRVARAMDSLLESARLPESKASDKSVEQLIKGSNACKARLLHYYAPDGSAFDVREGASVEDPSLDPVADVADDDSWCGVHTDHGLLTALAPAMYLFHPDGADDAKPMPIPAPSKKAGLYIKTRAGKTVKAAMPADCIAFQTGATIGQLSRNRLAGTPHFVRGSGLELSAAARDAVLERKRQDPSWKDVATGTVTRETLAVFLQPSRNERIGAETGE